MKLSLCAGERIMEGFKHHDIKPLPSIDYVCDLMEIEKFVEPYTCSEIHFTHALEHFPKAQTAEILGLVYRLLHPGGKLYIEVPNFAWHARLVLDGRDRDAVYYAFGGQLDEWDFHKTAFTPKILAEELEQAGFVLKGPIRDDSSLCVWAAKQA